MLCSTLWKNSGQLFAISIFESIRFVVDMNVTYTTTNKKETYQNEWYSKNISFAAHMKTEISWPRLKYFLSKNGQCVTKNVERLESKTFR